MMDDENLEENEQPATDDVEDEEDLKLLDRMLMFLKVCWRGLVCVFIPIIFLAILAPFPPEKYQYCAYTLTVMAVFWVTECIPLPITSFLPVMIFPLAGIMSTETTCKCYVNVSLSLPLDMSTVGFWPWQFFNGDTIIMFLGSLILAYAVEQSGLHRRLALFAVRLIGCSHYRLLFAMSFITMFASMWITNTAATTMMVPIVFAILKVFENQGLLIIYDTGVNGEPIASDVTTCYFCTISFSATIGGIGTLVGTATNLVFKGLFADAFPAASEYLSFPNFSAFTIPYMVILESLLYLAMLIQYFGFLRPNSKEAKNALISEEGLEVAKNAVEESWKEIGKITYWEVSVIVLFSFAMILFFCRSPQIFVGWGNAIVNHFQLEDKKFVKDSVAAMFVAFLMGLLPSTLDFFKQFRAKTEGDLPDKPIPSVLNWDQMMTVMPFSFMFLLGGGFALSQAANKRYSDLNGRIGDILKHLSNLPNYAIIFLVITVTVFVTNFAANVAVCNVVTPIVMKMAEQININPLWYNICAGLSASYCFCLPVGTPGNLIIQGAANIPTIKMIKAGVAPTVIAILVTWISICFWAPVIWPDLRKQPAWMYHGF